MNKTIWNPSIFSMALVLSVFALVRHHWLLLVLMIVVMVATVIIYMKSSALKTKNRDNGHLDAKNATLDDADRELRRFIDKPVIGKPARTALDEIKNAKNKERLIEQALAKKFSKTSLTYSKFASAIVQASDALSYNCSALVNRMNTFDVNDYRRIESKLLTGEYRNDNISNELQEEKGRLYAKRKTEMDAILADNEKILLGLDAFLDEIDNMDMSDSEKRSEAMLNEIHQLIDEAKYYTS